MLLHTKPGQRRIAADRLRRATAWLSVFAMLFSGTYVPPATAETITAPEAAQEEKVLICGLEESGPVTETTRKFFGTFDVHHHTKDCYAPSGELICGWWEGAYYHTHNEYCRDENGKLVCGLESRTPHTHTDACYLTEQVLTCGLKEEAGHQHAEACYETETKLTCGLEEKEGHTHTEDCRTVHRELTCEEKERPGHQHTDECYKTRKELTCGEKERAGHKHTGDCYKTVTTKTLICEKKEKDPVLDEDGNVLEAGHQHSDACYETESRQELACGQKEDPGHTHTDDCYTQKQDLICELKEDPGHKHTDECYTERSELTCGKKEEAGHTHTAECYTSETKLICKLEEKAGHTHTDKCRTEKQALVCNEPDSTHRHEAKCYDAAGNCVCGKLEVPVFTCTEKDWKVTTTVISEGHQHTDECYMTATPESVEEPTAEPTATPEPIATPAPTAEPTATPVPTAEPTATPVTEPTEAPSAAPSADPEATPTAEPTEAPSAAPSADPETTPTTEPTEAPSAAPSADPEATPTAEPTEAPSAVPSADPEATPTAAPTEDPSAEPDEDPETTPTEEPTEEPTKEPTEEPTEDLSASPEMITLVSEDDAPYRVSITFSSEVGIPEGTHLEIREEGTAQPKLLSKNATLSKSTSAERYASVPSLVTGQSLDDFPEIILYHKTLDISLVSEGEEIEPSNPGAGITVTVYLPDITDGQYVEVRHITENGSVLLDSTNEGGVITFTTDSFSLFDFTSMAREITSWTSDLLENTLFGRSESTPADHNDIQIDESSVPEGFSILEAFSTTRSGDLWLMIQRIRDLALGKLESISLYAVENGELAGIIRENIGLTDILRLSLSDYSAFALVRDSGLRRRMEELGNIVLSGLLPKNGVVEAADVTGDYEDSAWLKSAENREAVEGPAGEDGSAGGEAVHTIAAYDITVTNDGEAYQPGENPVTVTIRNDEIEKAVESGRKLSLWHILDNGTLEQVTDFRTEGNTLTFEASGFSAYVITYTVDFFYGDYDFHLNGSGEILLSDLLAALHISADLTDSKVTFTDETLLTLIPQKTGSEGAEGTEEGTASDWLIRSLAPFDTEETLTVMLRNGDQIVLTVTDQQIITYHRTASGETYRITVEYDEEAGIPEDAELSVSEILPEDDRYADYVSQSIAKLGVNEKAVELSRVFDIRIVDRENQTKVYEPDAPVKVSVQLVGEKLGDYASVDVIHFGGTRSVDEMNIEAADDTIEFTTESFSVYSVVATTLTETVDASDGNTYEIEVTYKSTSGIPMEGTALLVSELKPGDAGYDEYVAASAAKVGTKAENIELSRAFDIQIVDENDHSTVYEPTGDVTVSIRLVGETLNNYANLDVLHFVEDENTEGFTVYDMDSIVDGETVQFTTDSFSVYVVTGYVLETTIDIEGQTYKVTATYDDNAGIPGDAKLSVSEMSTEDEDYLTYLNNTAAALGVSAGELGYLRMFDISIVGNDGTEYKPNDQVTVTVELMDETETGNLRVVHFGDKTQELDAETVGDAVTFTTDSFSLFSFVDLTLIQSVVDAVFGSTYTDKIYENDDIIVSGKMPRTAIVEVNPAEVEIDGADVLVAYDIKIYAGLITKALGITWQPTDGALTVQMKSDAINVDAADVYHMADASSAAELVTENIIVEENTVIFEADTFSVYVVADGTYFCTYCFFNLNEYGDYIEYELQTDQGSVTFIQKVKNGESIVAPQNPVNLSEPDTTFIGWFVGNLIEVEGRSVLKLEDEPFDLEHLPPVTENSAINLYAKYSTFAHVVFHGQYDSTTNSYPVMATRRGELTGAGTGSAEIAIQDISAGYNDGSGDPLKNMVFYGWSYTPVQTPGEGLDNLIVDESITVTGNVDLYPLYRAVRWLSFSSGSHATYYGPEYHYIGTGRTALPIPERAGYVFDGWYAGAIVDDDNVILNLDGPYTDPGSGTVYPQATRISNANGTLIAGATDNNAGISVQSGRLLLSKNATLYANWMTAEVNYSINIWTEQSYGSGIYDFREQFVLQSATGASVSVGEAYKQLTTDSVFNTLHSGENISGEQNPYYGFAYNSERSDTGTKTVERDGTTMLNVYYTLTSSTVPSDGPFTLTFRDSETSSPSTELMTGEENGLVRENISAGAVLASYVPVNPSSGREGYTFNGWFADPTCTVRVFFTNDEEYTAYTGNKLLYITMPSTDITVFSGWKKSRYLVQIDTNYGALYWDNGTQGTGATWFNMDYGELISEYPHVTREYEESPSGTFYYVNHDYAYYQANGGDRKTYYTENISLATEYTTFRYSPDTYQYDGWYEVNLETGEETPYDFSTPISHDTYLKLHWRKTGVFYVEYNPVVTENGVTLRGTLNGEDDASLDGLQYADQAYVTLMRSAVPPEGYNFVGWKIRGDESNILYYPSQTFQLQGQYAVTVNGRETVVLDAVYVRVATASIVYNANGGNVSGPDYGAPAPGETDSSITWCDGDTATIANLINNSGIVLSTGAGFTRAGATIVGWNTKPDGSGEHFDLGGTYNVDTSGDPTLYAEWMIKIYFDKNSTDAEWGTGWDDYTLEGGKYYTQAYINALLPEPAGSLTHPRLGFEHWSREASGGAYRFTSETVTGEMTLYACWTGDLLVPFHAVELSGEERLDRSAWQIQATLKLAENETISNFSGLADYVEPPAGYTVYACVSDAMENVSGTDDRRITQITNDNGTARVTYANASTSILTAGQEIYLVYIPVAPEPVTVRIRYVKEGASGSITPVQGSTNNGSSASDTITYSFAPITLNGTQVVQNQEITVGTEDFLFSQESTAYFNLPPILDDATLKLDLAYIRIGIGDNDAVNLNAVDGKNSDLTLHLQIRDLQLQWSIDGENWTSFTAAQPTVYVIYRERGYELEITKTIPITTWTSADREFTLTLSSTAITSDTYDVKGTGYESVSATPYHDGEPGTIELTIKDGSRIRLLGLPRGEYTVVESNNDNYTLTAKIGPRGMTLSEQAVTHDTVTLTLSEDMQIDLTNVPDVICRIGDVFFYTLNEAVAYAGEERAGTATIRMLVDYTMPLSDALVIPSGYDITLATSNTSYTGTGAQASIMRDGGFGGTPMFTNYGTFTLDTITLDGASTEAASPMVQNLGTLNVNETAVLCNATSSVNGGAIESLSGTVNLSGTLSGNAAAQGGAVYASGGDVNISAGSLVNNTAGVGGAIYYTGSGALSISGGSVSSNTASSGNGGAVYVAGGTMNLTGGTIGNNHADHGVGGAVYATSALITIEEDTTIEENRAQSGGAVYADQATISLSGGTLLNNKASSGNGGAIYIGTGSVTLSGGIMSGNAASGNGGAVYAQSATITVSDGSLTANTATNGSAVFTSSGTANFSGGSIINNIATSGGAVGIGSDSVKLNFTNAPVISGNLMGENASNVYLDIDSDTILNTTGLSGGANIGIYVPGEFTDTLFHHRGEAGGSFASYPTSTVTNMASFHNDRLPELTVVTNTDARKLLWGKALAFEVRYLSSYQNGFPPAQAGQSKYTKNDYYPSSSQNFVSELAGDMYSLFSGKLTSMAAFGGAFAEGDTEYAQFLTEVNWDNETQEWKLVKRDGTSVSNKKLILYYAEPAYVTIENNTGFVLRITDLTVLNHSAFNSSETAGYGYVVARDGATESQLLPITQSDLTLGAGHSVKLLFPGAVNQNYTLSGQFTSASGEITCTRTGTAAGTISEADANNGFTLNGKTLTSNGGILEIKFGGEKPICKIVTEPIDSVVDSEIAGKSARTDGKEEYTFSSLKQAITFITAHALRTAKVEMLIDYLIPSADVVTLPEGYDITFTTATTGIFQYEGTEEDRRATISRDTGNLLSIIACNVAANSGTKLTVENLNFDGKSLVGNINGGVIKTLNCDVALKNADFLNCIANNGGGVYIEFSGNAGNNNGSLTAENVLFQNCRAKSEGSRQGGGAIWTDAATLELNRCTFYNCTAYDQGGAVFHRVDGIYDTRTTMRNCRYENCEAHAAGAIESDAKYVLMEDSSFKNCIATQRNGGGINIYSVNSASPAASVGSKVTVTRCTFENCHAYNTTKDGNGGGFRSTAVITTVTDCSFYNTTSRQGGAISVSNTNATVLTVTGTKIDLGSATQKGGGIYCTALTVQIGANSDGIDTLISNCTAGQNGGGICHEKSEATSSIAVQNTVIENCVATGGTGGGLQTNSRSVSLVNCSVLGNKASGNGGGVNSTDGNSMLTVDGCTIRNNESGGMGGGIYQASQMTLRNDSMITGNQLTTDTAGNAAGVYLNNMLTVGTMGATEPDASSIVGNLTVNRTPSDLRMRVNGNNNHTQSASILCDLNGKIYVVNAASRGTQFGLSAIAYPAGFADLDHVFNADDGSLYGIIDRSYADGKKIIWCTPPICKITDERGRLLYFDESGTAPMIFDKLDNGNDGTRNRATAFGYLRNTGASFYYKNGTEYTGDTFAVKMLVETYEQTKTIIVNNAARKIIFTTAGTSDSDGYAYTGRAGSNATIIRTNDLGNNRQMTVSSELSFQNITIDGGSLRGITPTGNTKIILANNANANITLGVGATLQNSSTTANGGAVELDKNSVLTIAGGMIRNCSANNGGGVYIGGNSQLTITAGSITLCAASGSEGRGGGVFVRQGTLNMSGGSITRCSAVQGGGVCVFNQHKLNMSGGSITGNTATERGGGIAVSGTDKAQNTRLYFAGLVNVSGNTLNGVANNLELDYDTNAIINSQGLYRGSVIGVYVPDGETLFDKHGNEGDPFGTFNGDTTYLYCFVNDRNGLKGGLQAGGQPNTIYWVVIFSLEVSKRVVSDSVVDTMQTFSFTVTLNGCADNNPAILGSSFNGVFSDDEERKMNFTDGVAHFTLKSGESVTANNIPAGITYTVEEDLTGEQLSYYTVLPSQTITGRIGENLNAEDVEFKYLSKAAFTNLHAVCKITAPVNGGALLYYKNEDDEYTPAVYSRLITAFQTVNTDTPLFYWDVYSDLWKPYNENDHHIEMLIPNYTMTDPITLNSGKNVTLTTASPNPRDNYPYVGNGTAIVRRGYTGASMITVNGNLALGSITMDGNGSNHVATVNGGIISVSSSGSLAAGTGTTLQNATTSGSGAGVYLSEGSAMRISGGPVFENNIKTSAVDSESKNGGDSTFYTGNGAPQDIFIAGYSSADAISLHVTGNITSGQGSIKVWAEQDRHYEQSKQFAVMDGGPWNGLDAFRNARTDADTGNRPKDTDTIKYLYGVTRGDGKVYWSGSVELSISKMVTGELADFSKDFTFTISRLTDGEQFEYHRYVRNADGVNWDLDSSENANGSLKAVNGAITFTLRHNQKIVLSIPGGTTLTVSEENGFYSPSYTRTIGTEADTHSAASTVELTLDKDTILEFTNEYRAVAPTDFRTRWMPYLLLLLCGFLLAVGSSFTARRSGRDRGRFSMRRVIIPHTRGAPPTGATDFRQPQYTGSTDRSRPQHTGATDHSRPQHTGSTDHKRLQYTGLTDHKRPQHTGSTDHRRPQQTGSTDCSRPRHTGSTDHKWSQHTGSTDHSRGCLGRHGPPMGGDPGG